MKFLLDMPVSILLLDVLQIQGHQGVHAHQIGKSRASDKFLKTYHQISRNCIDIS